ncbi:hypothetical protein VP01_956g2 [Puccinia sorghi]|uniref:Uncharacterized protein n=1 Tax=Puccinia sorghi TaxID=27349 RepID=A0A0L6U680_9BASI|nr:hypothetical protein VP01_956g2 [Puccinia sorghi]
MDLDFIVINIGRIVCSNIVFTFVSAQIIDLPWETSVRSWGIEGYKPIQEKFIQLAFLRRYPKLFYNERFNLNRRAELLGSPLDSVRNSLLAKVNSSPSTEVDLIEKGYSAAYLEYGDINIPILHILKKYATSWQSDTQFAPYTCLVGSTMIGKSRLLMKLAVEICVVCISDSATKIPPFPTMPASWLS